jgi:hypothetical protein
MAYVPLSGYLTQLITQTGQVASDYYIKFYIANTTTPLSMAKNRGASTLLVKAKFNNNGMPITNPLDNSTEFIPHLNQAYRLVVYRNEADADADNTADSYVNIPEIYALLSASNIGTAADQIPQNGDFGTAARVDTGAGAGNVPLNSDLGTASLVNTGAGASNVPLNSDLGSASLVDTGLLTGNVPTADDMGMVGQTVNWHGGNFEPTDATGLNARLYAYNNSGGSVGNGASVSGPLIAKGEFNSSGVFVNTTSAIGGGGETYKNVNGTGLSDGEGGLWVRTL